MKSALKLMGLMFLSVTLCLSGTAFADENEVVDLKNQITELQKELDNVKKQIRGMQPATTYAAPEAPQGGLIRTMQDITMGGHIDTQWNNNFRQPPVDGTFSSTNPGRIFDNHAGDFSVNNAEIYFEKAAVEAKDAGFRIDLNFGNDALVVDADGDDDTVNLQQAYVEYIAPLGFFEGNNVLPSQVKIMAGRFATLAGYEVIEGPANYNISRSFTFGYSLPFIHTGVRTNFGLFNDYFDVYLGVNNGWDQPIDNNSYKTLEFAIGYDPFEKLSMFHSFYWGGEKDDTGAGKRWLMTHVATYSLTDKLTLVANVDIGTEHNIPDGTVPAYQTNDAAWWAFAGYVNYQFTDKFSTTARYEIFYDDAVARTGIGGRFFAQTYTAEYKLHENLIARGEFRHDVNQDNSLFSGVSGASEVNDDSSQSTIAAQLIYLI